SLPTRRSSDLAICVFCITHVYQLAKALLYISSVNFLIRLCTNEASNEVTSDQANSSNCVKLSSKLLSPVSSSRLVYFTRTVTLRRLLAARSIPSACTEAGVME